jgi:hypothetical protein
MNEQDLKEIDRHLTIVFDEWYNAAKQGKSKYENNHEPGSLPFDAWAAGWRTFDSL